MKKIVILLLAAMLTLSLCACGEKEKTVDVQALADALAQGVAFDSEMIPAAVEEIRYTLDVPDSATVAGYQANGTGAEQIAVVQCAAAADAAAVKASVDTYLSDLSAEAGKYQPEEQARIDGAVVQVSGSAVVLCITSDTDTAKGIIKEYLG